MGTVGTVCKKCGLFYQYPKRLDWERNPCPRCEHPNSEQQKRVAVK
jgi:uncharacterized OB-fold protein